MANRGVAAHIISFGQMHGRAGCAATDQPQPNSAFAALNQAKIIENRLASPKPDRLLKRLNLPDFPNLLNEGTHRAGELLLGKAGHLGNSQPIGRILPPHEP